MAINSRRKRPCSICRKWFLPDVRQIGRQKTCGPDCSNELHRRQCEEWNRKNKAYPKNNYLAKKIEHTVVQDKTSDVQAPAPQRQRNPVLPMEIVTAEFGTAPAVIIQYLVAQVVDYTTVRIRGSP